MQIGNIKLKNSVLAAPMAGVTNSAFRIMLKRFGCSLVCSEMISSYGIVNENLRTFNLLQVFPAEHPVSIQIFGNNPEVMAEAAKIVATKADIIDINMGCPVPKVLKSGSGGALLKDSDLARRIVKEVVNAVDVPVTAKIRKGWDSSDNGIIDFAKSLEAEGLAGIVIHGRTVKQSYRGEADWKIAGELKEALEIPVIGNGDIKTPEDAKRFLEETGCDGVMIGRAMLGRPWIFKQITKYLENGELISEPDFEEQIEIIKYFVELTVKFEGEESAILKLRKHLLWFFKGMPFVHQIRLNISKINTLDKLINLLDEYKVKGRVEIPSRHCEE